MNRWPVLPSLIVSGAIIIMLGLGVWQLQRHQWKQALLADYAAASGMPAIDWPRLDSTPENLPLYRRSGLDCERVADWRATSGRRADGSAGWVQVATCQLPDGQKAQLVAGWSDRPEAPVWAGGTVKGTIAPDSRHGLRLVASPPVAGLQPVQPPSLDDIPNNHFAYAVQWFLFAISAAVIYLLALRRRQRAG